MSFEDRKIDDRKLMDEIDELEDNFQENVIIDSKINKHSFRKNLIFVILLVIVLVSYVIYEKYVIQKNNYGSYYENFEDYNKKQEIEKAEFEILKKNINVILKKDNLQYGNIIVGLENNNEKDIYDFDINLIFYDSLNNPIDINSKILNCIESGKKTYIKFEDYPDEYERFEVLITKKSFYNESQESLSSKIDYKVYDENNLIKIKGRNHSSKKIDRMQFDIVYYNENKEVIGISNMYFYDIKPEKEFELNDYGPYNTKNYESIDYSSYEINLVYAF